MHVPARCFYPQAAPDSDLFIWIRPSRDSCRLYCGDTHTAALPLCHQRKVGLEPDSKESADIATALKSTRSLSSWSRLYNLPANDADSQRPIQCRYPVIVAGTIGFALHMAGSHVAFYQSSAFIYTTGHNPTNRQIATHPNLGAGRLRERRRQLMWSFASFGILVGASVITIIM